jgi:hypothetical protein
MKLLFLPKTEYVLQRRGEGSNDGRMRMDDGGWRVEDEEAENFKNKF